MSRGRYRWRTWLRGCLPWRPPLYRLIPKGADCGDHEWYRIDATAYGCYHCRVGLRRGADEPPPWDQPPSRPGAPA